MDLVLGHLAATSSQGVELVELMLKEFLRNIPLLELSLEWFP
jgi:hypothetical protein